MQLNFNGTHHRSRLVLECKILNPYSLQNDYQRKTKTKPPHGMPTSSTQKWGPPSTGWPHRKEGIWLPRAAKKHSLEGAAFTVQMETLRPRPSKYFPKLAWPPTKKANSERNSLDCGGYSFITNTVSSSIGLHVCPYILHLTLGLVPQ